MAPFNFSAFTFVKLFSRLFNFNSKPIAQSQTQNLTENAGLFNGQLIASDPNGDPITFLLAPNQVAPAGFTLNSNGSYSFDQDDTSYDSLGLGDTQVIAIDYVVKDSRGAVSQTRTLTINLAGTNDAPTITAGPVVDANSITFTAEDIDSDTLTARVGTTNLMPGTVNNGSPTTSTITALDTALFGELNVFDGTDSVGVGLFVGIGTISADTLTAIGTNPAVLYGFEGDDRLTGADQDDTILGGDGNDTIIEINGNNLIEGNNNNDSIVGGTDSDRINGGAGADTILGGDGADTIDGGLGNDSIFGDSGNDNIRGFGDSNTILGGSGNDTIEGTIAGSNSIDGGENDDVITEIGFGSTLLGGLGNDSILGFSASTINGGDGSDTINVEFGNNTIDGGMGNDSIEIAINPSFTISGSGNTVSGSNGNDTIIAINGSNLIEGNNDNDSIVGGTDSDTINGGTGADTLTGGLGSDTFSFAATGDGIAATSGENGSVTFGNGFDYITDFESIDSIIVGTDGFTIQSSVGTAFIDGDGNYVIVSVGMISDIFAIAGVLTDTTFESRDPGMGDSFTELLLFKASNAMMGDVITATTTPETLIIGGSALDMLQPYSCC